MQHPFAMYLCLQGLATLCRQQGQLQQACIYHQKACTLVARQQLFHRKVESHSHCAQILYRLVQPQEAERHLYSARRCSAQLPIEAFWLACAEACRAIFMADKRTAQKFIQDAERRWAAGYRGCQEMSYQLQLLQHEIAAI